MADLLYESQYFTTTLSVAGGINASQTTGIVLQNVSGVSEPTKPGLCLLSYSDPLDTTKAEWIIYRSINTTTKELVGVTRGQEGSSGKPHSNGVVVAFPHSKSHINRINDKLTGVDTGVSLNQPTLTSPTITGTALASADGLNVSSLYRQAIINGNFDVWQRGTSQAISDVTFTFTADRWLDYADKNGGTLPTLTRSRQALTAGSIPNAFYCSRLAFNGAGTSLGTLSQHVMEQRIEHGTRLLCGNGKKVTLSFWARSDVSNKKMRLSATQSYGTGGSPSANETLTGSIITLTSTWTKYTVTITTNTLVGKTFGTNNDDFLQLDIRYMWGTAIESPAETYVGAGYVDIAQVQLCAGDVALPFQPKSFEEELRACQWYYEKSFPYEVAPAQNVGSSTILRYPQFLGASTFQVLTSVAFKVRKRVVPTMTLYNPSANNASIRNIDSSSDWSGSTALPNEIGFYVFGTSGAGAVGSQNGFHWTADAEL